MVSRHNSLMESFSSSDKSRESARWPSFKPSNTFLAVSNFKTADLSRFASFSKRGRAFSMVPISARTNSVLMVSTSLCGSTLRETCSTLGSVKKRTTSQIASVSRMLAKNLLPKPSPCEAPATKPAMSTNSTVAGTIFAG